MSEEMKSRKEKVLYTAKNGYDRMDASEMGAMEEYCRVYKDFLDNGKTERLCARQAVKLAQAKGFVPYRRGMELKAGDKVYTVNRGKGVMLAVIGEKSLAEGCQITASHIDSPRLDLKPPSMRTARWPISRPIITAASASTSGSPSPWSCGAWWR